MTTLVIVYELQEHPRSGDYATNWWHVVDGVLAESGAGDTWLDLILSANRSELKQVALAPPESVRLHFSERPAGVSTDRQAIAVASAASIGASLGDADALHAVSSIRPDGEIVTAVVSRQAMLRWLAWTAEAGADPAFIVPSSILLPLSDGWSEARFGAGSVIGRTGQVLPAEPALSAAIVGDGEVEQLDDATVEKLIADAATNPPLNLRTGKFSRRRRLVLERARLRELAILAAAIPLLMLLWGVVAIAKINGSARDLDRDSVAIAQRALGHAVSIETAEAELAQRSASSTSGGLLAPLTELYSVLQPQESVSATLLSYSSDGTLSVTLAAPTMDAISQAVVALQRDGYTVTAVTRQSPDGRAVVDATVRSRP